FIILQFILFSSATFAQVHFDVTVPGSVRAGERFPVTFVLRNAEGSNPKLVQTPGITQIYGPSVSTSQSTQVINGRMSSSSRIEYTYFFKADKPGKYSIGEASIVVDGKTMKTSAKTINVVQSSSQSPDNQSSGGRNGSSPVDIYDIDTQSADRNVNADDVFVRIILSKSSAYEQEAIECTIKLYTRYQISSFFPTLQPSFDGFLIQELDLQPTLNQEEEYRGSRYMTAVLKKCIIFPQKSGRLTINSGNYDIKVVQYNNVNMGFFTVRDPQEREIKVKSNSASIDIKPLPTPQPDGFTGAVGTFTVDSRLVGNSFRTNDAATLLYTIKGTGNIKYLKEPEIDFPSEFEQYTPKSDINAEVSGQNVTGTMTIEYTFVPQSVGDFKIGSDKFVYFNPVTKEYVTIETPVYNIKVSKGANSSPSESERQDISAKNTDILHIYTGDKHVSQNHILLAHQWWYWLLYIIGIIGFISIVAIYSRHAKRASDIQGTRLAKANKIAKKRLRIAEKFAKEGNEEKFYEEMLRALWGYISDKLSIPASKLSRQNVSEQLSSAGVSDSVITPLIDVLDTCEMARYTPQKSADEMSRVYREATDAINGMENTKIKK
ncbi:MAG: BatD family protein, partial [Paramuribaculum sp.]|nr:BatD family protein [Paramuribaculum sp.]